MFDLFRFGVLFWVTVVAGVAVGLLGALAWREQPKPGARPLAVTMAAATVWTWASAVGFTAQNLAARLFWTNFEWMAVFVLPVAWLWVCLEYTGRRSDLSGLSSAFGWSFPITFTAVLWLDWFVGPPTSGLGLFRESAELTTFAGVTLIQTSPGPVYWLFVGYAYVLVGGGLTLLAEFCVDTETPYRRQAGAMFVAGLVPACSGIVYAVGLVPITGFNPTPMTLLLTGTIGVSALTRLDLLHAVPGTSRVAREAVVERMDDAVVVVDNDDRIVDCNTSAVTFLGCSPTEAIGRSAIDLVPGYEAVTGESDDTATVSTQHGQYDRYVDVRRTPFREHGSGSIIVLRNVTDRKRREQRLDVLNRVLRHNLRNDLNVVYGFVDHMMNRREYDHGAMETIKETTESLLSIGNKARTLERLLDDDEDTPLPVRPMLEREVERLREAYPSVTVEVESLPESTYCTGAIGSIARDLLENAAEHNTASSPTVWIDATRHGGELVLCVRDNGPGLPPEEQAVLEQGHETGLEHGSGLGLWLVLWATRRMGGTVSFDQAPEGGCEAVVRVPVQDPPETADEESALPPEVQGHSSDLSALDERVPDRLSPDATAEDTDGTAEDADATDDTADATDDTDTTVDKNRQENSPEAATPVGPDNETGSN